MRQGIYTFYILLALLLLPAINASIVSVTTPIAAGTYGAASQIPIILTYDAPVTVQGSPALLTNAGTAVLANQSGTQVTFLYVVNASDSGALAVQSIDTTAGNISDVNMSIPASSLGITLDGATNSSPTISFAIPSLINQSNVSLNVSFGSQSIVSTSAQLTGSSTQSTCINCIVSLSDGTYTLTVTAQNAVGLTTTATASWRVDTAAPVINAVKVYTPSEITVSAGQIVDASQSLVNITVDATDNITIKVNGATVGANGTAQLNLSPGLNSVSVSASDGLFTTTRTFSVRVATPFNVASLASALASNGVTMTAVVNGLDVTEHLSLGVSRMNVTLSVANVTYTLTNVYIPAISPDAASTVSVTTSDSSLTGLANASTLYWLRNIVNARSVFTQFDSLSVQASYPYSASNVTVISYDSGDTNITRPTTSIANGNATFTGAGFGVAIAEDGIAPSVVSITAKNVADTSATAVIVMNEPSTCRITTRAGTYSSMSQYIESSIPTAYTAVDVSLTGLTAGTGYTEYVSCIDRHGNAMNTSQSVAFTTSGTAPVAGSSGSSGSSSSGNTKSLSSSDRTLLESMGRDTSLYVDVVQRDSASAKSQSVVDAAAVLALTSKVNGKLVAASVRTTATTYELFRADGASDIVTRITTRVSFNNSAPERFDVIEAIPKAIAKNSGKLTGSYSVLESDPVIVFARKADDTASNELTITYSISGDKLNAANQISTVIADRTTVKSPTTSNSGSATGTTGGKTTPSGSTTSETTVSAWKIAGYIAVSLLALLAIIWFIGKYFARNGGAGGSNRSFGSGHVYRENFVHRD